MAFISNDVTNIIHYIEHLTPISLEKLGPPSPPFVCCELTNIKGNARACTGDVGRYFK